MTSNCLRRLTPTRLTRLRLNEIKNMTKKNSTLEVPEPRGLNPSANLLEIVGRIEISLEQEHSTLNATAAETSNLAKSLQETAGKVASLAGSAEETASSMNEVAASAEEVSANLAQVATSAAQTTVSVRELTASIQRGVIKSG
jgi:methyl-accepting chemotaxis protein